LETKWLHDFVSLAATGNFSRSAEDRNVTQSAFSRRIQSLEQWLGTELVDRKTHPVTLTDAGIRFLKPAKNMIRQAERMKDDFRERTGTEHDSLTFTSSTNLAIAYLPQWLTQIKKELGPFDVKVQTDVSGIHDHFEALRNRQSDFLLHYGHGVGMLAMDASKFEYTVIEQDVLVPVCHHSLSRSNCNLLKSNSKRRLPYISPWRNSSIAYLIAEKIARSHPAIRLDTVVESSIVGCTKGFVAQAVGVAWLPVSAIKDEIESGEFVKIADASFEISLAIELYRYPPNTHPMATTFWEHVKQRKPGEHAFLDHVASQFQPMTNRNEAFRK